MQVYCVKYKHKNRGENTTLKANIEGASSL